MEKAVFLDRDGVINANVFNKKTGEWESPHEVSDLHVFPWGMKALHCLQDHQFKLFLVSNQPSYAKGKTSLENIKAIHQVLHAMLADEKIFFTDYYYCYHHPQGIDPEFSVRCDCRKPGTLFLEDAQKKYNLDMKSSWMIGDRDSDIQCGRKAGVKTVLILDKAERLLKETGKSDPDFHANNLLEAVKIVTNEEKFK